jgi:quercetin dioxygenase-like cupin family protein
MLIAVVDLEPHSVVEEHSHPHEQVGMLLQGTVTFFIGSEQKTLQAGDMYRIPGNVKHKVINSDQPARAVDIFCPIRTEYL